MNQKYSYDDVLLKPKKSPVSSLSDVETSSNVGGIDLKTPIFSAPMDTVTEKALANKMSKNGAVGVIHRFMTEKKQKHMVSSVCGTVGAAVGLNEYERAQKIVSAGADYIVADIAHGHHEEFINFVSELDDRFDQSIVAGNVATKEAVVDLSEAGADVLKIGVGPGAACTTREMTGAGVPQFSAVKECSEQPVDIIADGGIRKPGDMCKALMAGADAVMMGSEFGSCVSSPKDGEFRGMSTKAAAEDRDDRDLKESDSYEEGEVMVYDNPDRVEDVIQEYLGGLRSGISYCGADNLEEARENAEFVKITNSTQYRNGAHGQP